MRGGAGNEKKKEKDSGGEKQKRKVFVDLVDARKERAP